MKVLVIYDSMYGNTKKVAETVAENLKHFHGVELLAVTDLDSKILSDTDFLVVGTPTQGGRPTENIQKFLDRLEMNSLQGTKVAAFDTRFSEQNQNFALRTLLRTVGYAAPRITDALKIKGGDLVAPPEGFIVSNKKGPLANGELERAKTWAISLATL
ncbi:hypothetical protein A2473_01350 [candidate division WWE3 bacterium RIFOXYC2_FULL_42_13]|nr:MAG: hypothetical protein A2245_02145 [candidate division WWE3 bacterium RIFOXYA2_FULL_43_12]OGC73655.1 MAG: hypothetical protein A2473_01350 [candidate division WWE3 bacterium RIFOXYC2_FULL_42_13]OGC74097.1 MAG: hypothetical protein A2337_00035 [candidate division WWE3 bacterium RIFOXYB2_FULL_43_9]OGC75223.1 MAG: hypothetical protein A2547_02315 [candidate division WWE3 bacterium RIFOXYD2_FULL_43_10]